MFEKTLTDIVKGIRASKRDTALYISQCIAEIKQEINSTDLYVKANALNKLTFLQMMGYSMSWASFASIEVMSSPRFAHKRIGYLAACQGFNQNTEVILLTTNLLQKELRGALGGTGMYEAGLAINCISNIVTEDLARDVLPEVTNILHHPQPYLKKKAVLCLLKIFVKYPQGLRLTFDKIQALLEDSNPSVVSCAVNVVTELSDKNPKNYLHLAPAFFQLLTQSQNNWMLIKVVKLLGSLVPEEPRLARKLLEPLAGIVQSTQAKSLLYEAVYTITLCLPYCRKADGSMPANVPQIVQLCSSTLKDFCADKDPNLKYLGLVGFASLRQSHPKCLEVTTEARPLILACLSDEDVTIRTRALDLLPGMVSRKNCQELVGQLLRHVEAASGQYKKDLVLKILELCTSDKYALLQDFDWYLDILLKLSYISPEDLGSLLEKQLLDVALRVLPVRSYAVQECTKVLIQTSDIPILPQVLPAAAWIVGEYSEMLQGDYWNLVHTLTSTSNVTRVATSTQSIYIQSALKVFCAATQKAPDGQLVQCVESLHHNLPVYMESCDPEVQERAFTGLELLKECNLTPGDGIPGLTMTEEEDGEEDLLEMTGAPKARSSKKMSSNGSLVSRCKGAATTLNYLLKPEPMKPISAKVQKKKRQSPMGGISVEWLEAPLDLSVFSYLDDIRDLPKPSMEQVSFTQQRPFQPVTPTPVNPSLTTMDLSILGGSDASRPLPRVGPAGGVVGGEKSGLNQPHRQQDPFYLDTGGTVTTDPTDTARFGTIQLLDSDEEEDPLARKRRKKKEKKMKKKQLPAVALSTEKPATVYDSDDDEEKDGKHLPTHGNPKKSNVGKDFAGLALVDLTTPLAEDEVMPKREHRKVPERVAVEEEVKVSSKRKKKKKEPRTKTKNETGGGVADLLGLGETTAPSSFLSPSDPSITIPAHSIMESHMTAISSAFDDLLDLGSPPASVTQPGLPSSSLTDPFAGMAISPSSPATKKGGKMPWMKAMIKTSSADGPPSADWNQVAVFYKVLQQSNDISGVSASIVLRIQNDMTSSALTNLTLNFKLYGEFSLGTIAANDSEVTKMIGPFSYDRLDSSLDLKGVLSTSGGCRVPIRMILPASLHLVPSPGLSLETVMQELSGQPFSSSSAKIELENVDADKARSLLTSFFSASPVGDSMEMLAAQSNQGSKVRILLKIRDQAVKVDIKSTSETLSKSLAADVKRLVL